MLKIEMRNYLSALYLLDKIIFDDVEYKIAMFDTDPHKDLEPILVKMATIGYLEMDTPNNRFVASKHGSLVYNNFKRKFNETNDFYYIYNYVDLEKGEFAFYKYSEMKSSSATDDEFLVFWDKYVESDDWEDLRLTVLRYKLLGAGKSEEEIHKAQLELVFCSMLDEGRFDKDEPGYLFDVYSGEFATEAVEIVEAALKYEQLGDEDVIQDIINQGSLLLNTLNEEDLEEEEEDEVGDDDEYDEIIEDEIIEEIEEEEIIYADYYEDPCYISPVWLGVGLIILLDD